MNSSPPDAAPRSASDEPVALTHDMLFGGKLLLTQPARGHRAGTDAVLLAAAVPATTGLIVDVGAGVGTAGLAIALRAPEARVMLLEQEPLLSGLARRNVIANAVEDRVSVIEADLLSADARGNAGLRDGTADVVITNPPFFDAARGTASPDRLRRVAHVERNSLEEWLPACVALLRPRGRIVLIHRADALETALASLMRSCGAITLRAVHAHAARPATRIIVSAMKGSRASTSILPALVLHGPDGRFSREAAALHGPLTAMRPGKRLAF